MRYSPESFAPGSLRFRVQRSAIFSCWLKANQLIDLRISEYKALIAAADLSGHYGVRVLLESCLADKIAFVERTRRLIQSTAEATRVAEIFTARPAA